MTKHSTFCFLYLLMPFLCLFLFISAAVFCLVIPFRSFRLVILTSLVSNLLFNLLNFFFTTLSTCHLHRIYHTYSKCAFDICMCVSVHEFITTVRMISILSPPPPHSLLLLCSPFCSSCPPSQETAGILCYHGLVCIFYNFV